MPSVLKTRPSPISGRWYPGDAKALARQIEAYLAAAQLPVIEDSLLGIVVPHAGYMYSGQVAAHAYAAIRDLSPEIIAVVSPIHQFTTSPLLTTAHSAYMTPFGEVVVAKELVKKVSDEMQSIIGIGLEEIAYDQEHSLEIQLPFLQYIYPKGFRLLPIMVRDVSKKVTKNLGIVLATILKNENAILVASTDLSHFYPQSIAEKLDSVMLQKVKDLDPDGVLQAEEEGKGFACGRGALASVLWAAKDLGANHAKILNYATSGNITGDTSQVVGYMAAALIKTQ